MANITLDVLRERLADARSYKADWNTKAQRLTEIALGVPRGQLVRTDIEEAHTNYLLINLTLKVASLVSAWRRARVRIYGVPPVYSQWYNEFIKDSAVADVEDALKDRFITGLGVLALGAEGGRTYLYRVDPLDVWWSPRSGLRHPLWVIRRYWVGDVEFYEYWDRETHAVWTGEGGEVFINPNLLGFIPIRFLTGFSVPRIDFPVGDIELAYPQQLILNEIRRTLLDQARRGVGFYEVSEADADPYELEKLREPGEVVIRTRTGSAIRPLPTPPVNAEWLQLEAIAKNDLDAQTGVSEYLRGSVPIANNLKFATQVLAAIGAQNLRIEADWTPLKEALEWSAIGWLRWAKLNGERKEVGDLIVDAGALDISGVSAVVEEEDVGLVKAIGISPDAITQTE